MARTKAEIQRSGLKLFKKQGFEETTVAQIAEAAEVSPMTVFRYFPTKEDIALWDSFDTTFIAEVQRSGRDKDAITRIGSVLLNNLTKAGADSRNDMLVRLELALATPSLRARGWDNLYLTQQALATALGSSSRAEHLRNVAAAAACLAAVSAALFQWATRQGKDDPVVLAREALIVIGAKVEGGRHEPRQLRTSRK